MLRQSSARTLQVETLPVSGVTPTRLLHALREDVVAVWEGSDSAVRDSFFTIHPPGRYSYFACSPQGRFAVDASGVCVMERVGASPILFDSPEQDPLEVLQELQTQLFSDVKLPPTFPAPFVGGVLGYVGYDAIRFYERIDAMMTHPREPAMFFYFIDRLLVFDSLDGCVHLLSLSRDTSDAAWRETIRSRLGAIDRCAGSPDTQSMQPFSTPNKEAFVSAVSRAKEYIRAGDIFQVVLAQTQCVHGVCDDIDAYTRLRQANPSPYHFLLRFSDSLGESLSFVGASPEVMLQGTPRGDEPVRVFMRPVAGTYPRVAMPAQDAEQAQALAKDEKERAEHLMLVDLERNDIGRVAELGSVCVSDLFSIETYRDVHHLVSQVSGTLPPHVHPFEALRSCLPIGTLAGAPKIRAMEIIAELEHEPRGAFGGAMVMHGVDGLLDSCVLIRFASLYADRAVVKAGAGIVDDSDPEREFAECRWKAEAVLHALGCHPQSQEAA